MKTVRIRSGAPLFFSGLAVLAYAAVFGMGSIYAYVGAAVLFFLVNQSMQRFFPDRFEHVENIPHASDAGVNQLINESITQLDRIRGFGGEIYDPWLSEKLEGIMNGYRQLLTHLSAQPALQGQLRTFLRYYLPTTVMLLQIRVKLQDTRNASPTALGTRRRIDEALLMIEKAVGQQLEAIDHMEQLSVETEMQVLKELLGQSGILNGQGQPKADEHV